MLKGRKKSHRLGTRRGMGAVRGVDWPKVTRIVAILGSVPLLSNRQSYGKCYATF